MKPIFQIQMRLHSKQAFVDEGKPSDSEAAQVETLERLNWIEPDFEWRIVKIVNGVMMSAGKLDWGKGLKWANMAGVSDSDGFRLSIEGDGLPF